MRDNDAYTVSITDFLFEGGDGYSMFKDAKVIIPFGASLRDLFLAYAENGGKLRPPEDKDRIVRVK